MIVAMFPGQGAQVVGMGRALAEGYEVARRTFEEADDVLGYALSQICFEGPAERLMETDVCQPALVATSVAAFRVASDAGLQPGLVMGHSLGEYSALVAGGALGLAEGVRLVAERGAAMLEAGRTSPGAMAAVIGLSDDDARALAEEAGDVWPANFNCPGQVVVSGTVAGVDRLVGLAEERSVRVMRLAVDGAYHSPLMEPAAARLKPALEAWDPVPSNPPFLSTTTGIIEPPERLRKILLAQMTSPVLFGDAVEAALALGAERFVELGPGRVLSGLVRRIRRDAPVVNVAEPGDVDALATVG